MTGYNLDARPIASSIVSILLFFMRFDVIWAFHDGYFFTNPIKTSMISDVNQA
ncbi:MAG: hypothetical protein LBI56_02120 [Puniceicoccales bacterium]|nr:hypothetical protein [Puniceicoccales bacterium]